LLRFKLIEYIGNVDDFPKAIRRTSGHCRANFLSLGTPKKLLWLTSTTNLAA